MDQFFRPSRIYAVAGASTNPAKFGFKVFKWYKDHNLNAGPVNPKDEPVLGVRAVPSVSAIDVPTGHELSVSVVTPPAVTQKLVDTIASQHIPVAALWLQPGTHTPEVVEAARKAVPNVITDCILVKGDHFLSKL